MERILLVEPNYKNKYPPIGLMKISTYFKLKGDHVEFHKGLLSHDEVRSFDRILITTLFTFDFKMCIETIRYYIAIVGIDKVCVGGIAATIMPERFLGEIPQLNILKGQIISSTLLGYHDNINIDNLELDYDILQDVSYDYEMADSYFIYTSRGCPRKCEFCAVKTLEPDFYDCNNIAEQVVTVDRKYGIKKRLLIMDNNILFSKNFNGAINTIKKLGFSGTDNKIQKNNQMKYYIYSLFDRVVQNKKYESLLSRIKKDFFNLKFVRINSQDALILKVAQETVLNGSDAEIIEYIVANQCFLISFFEKYNYHKIARFVDFNQGLDARLFTKTKARKLSEVSIKPCRIAFDTLKTKKSYFSALNACIENGIKYFSNYLLYNFEEKPCDLWIRLSLNIQFCENHPDIFLFSFPMKYASIHETDRNYIGKHWNKKYLRAINVILNVTKGVVAKENDFFYRAFGSTETDFLEILSMPDEFIRYRDFFEKRGLTEQWLKLFRQLTPRNKNALIGIVSNMVDDPSVLSLKYNNDISAILKFYSLRKNDLSATPKENDQAVFISEQVSQ